MPDVTVDANLVVDDGVGGDRQFSVDDLKTPATGAATQATVASVLTELQGTLDADVVDRAGRLLGHVAVDNFPASGATEVTLQAVLDELEADLKESGFGAATYLFNLQVLMTSALAALENRYGGGKTAISGQVTAATDTVIHTPASGKRIQVFWFSALNDPDQTNSPRIRLKFTTSGTVLYDTFATAHWEVFTGGVDETLTINLDQSGSVSWTAHIKEI